MSFAAPRKMLVASSTPAGAVRSALLQNRIAGPRLISLSRSSSSHIRNPTPVLYRTIVSQSTESCSKNHRYLQPCLLQTPSQRLNSVWNVLPARHSFHSTVLCKQQRQQENQKTNTENAEESAKDDSKKEDESQQSKNEQDESSNKEGRDKKEPPPPPPHGDKTPWQVFTETLRSEFKASKEWNESTKALASSAHQFTESESVRRARAAYEAASGAASSRTSSALKSTGKVVGQGAAWTWDTSVVKGLRHGVAATGKGFEKATRPVRETKAYKSAVGGVKDVIDDGSSSRYGGWIEKEERRKQRELREMEEAKSGKRKVEQMVEDPK